MERCSVVWRREVGRIWVLLISISEESCSVRESSAREQRGSPAILTASSAPVAKFCGASGPPRTKRRRSDRSRRSDSRKGAFFSG